MNILYICADRGIPIRGHKGAAVHVRAMSNAFCRMGHNVTLVTPRPGPANGTVLRANIYHVPLPPQDDGEPDAKKARDRQSQNYRDVLYAAITNLLQTQNYDLIYERHSLWSDVGGRLSLATRLPLVLEVNAPLLAEAGRYRSLSDYELAVHIEEAQFRAATAVSVVSELLRDYVIQHGALVHSTHVLPNGVDPRQFHPAVRGGAVRERYNLHGRIVVGFAGRARPWHDLDTLFRAFARLYQSDPRYHLLLVGQMPDEVPGKLVESDLIQAATLTGPVPHAAVPTHLAAMNVAVSSHLPLDDFYFSPLKLVEYLACGVPTVAADIGQPARLVVEGETGSLYQPGNAASLAAKIRHLVENHAAARQVAWQGAVKVLQKYSWDKNAEAVINWVQPATPESLPENAAETELPILDRKLRQRLYRATRPDLAQKFLARSLPYFNKKGPAQLKRVGQIDVLKYKPGRRCVLRYDLHGRLRHNRQAVRNQYVGKVFRDNRGLRLHKLQKMLWHNGFGPDAADGIHVPDSVAYVPEMRMQVQGYAPGETLNDLVTKKDIKPLIPLAARGLAKLHNLPVPPPANGEGPATLDPYLLGDELKNIDRFTASLEEDRPQAMRPVLALRGRLLCWAQEMPFLPAEVPIHRDFYYSQLLFNGRQLTLIDFDLFAVGDPAIDVANFMAHLHFLGMDKLTGFNALADESDLFLAEYCRCRPPDDTFRERLSFYHAATFYRLLNVVAPRPGLVHLFDPLLAHAATALEMV